MLTNSRLRDWRACPRREYLGWDLMLEPSEKPEYLTRGSAFHAEKAGIEYEANPYLRAVVKKVAAQYVEPFEIVAREVPFEIPLVNPDTGRQAAWETLGGHIDAIGQTNSGRLVIVERKTTTRPVEELFSRLDIDTQVLTYWIGAKAAGYAVTGVMYCVQPWPGERPKKATPEDKRKYTKEGKLYANQRDRDETPEEYAARCEVEPATFREVAVLDDSLLRHRRELWHIHKIRQLAQAGGYTYRNPNACEFCQFVNICGGEHNEKTPVPDGFIRQARVGQATLGV